MKKNKFRFNIGDHVFILGKTGRCVVTGRGQMEFASGGKLNMYQISGGHQAILAEIGLITPAEMNAIMQDDG
jgi:hypothetical protein